MVTRSPVSFGVPFHGPHSPQTPTRAKREIPAPREGHERCLYQALRLQDVPAGERARPSSGALQRAIG
jgi:hypothetical protein